MIALISGKLISTSLDSVVVEAGGIGYRVFIPSSLLAGLPPLGSEVKFFTHHYVRQDTLALYGFLRSEELELFELLLTVSGIGPKAALSLLSVYTPEKLQAAISQGRAEVLASVPGIGQKTAARLVLELRPKMKGSAGVGVMVGESDEIMTALKSLGYNSSEAQKAIAALPEDEELSVESKLRLALRYLGQSR